jgi:hypothetical protein
MIWIFNGTRRTLGAKSEKELFVKVDVALRRYLRHFKPAEFMVFMALALRIDEGGECYPSYDTLEEDTGLNRAAVARAVKGLSELKIDGHAVLAIRRERDDQGHFKGNNIYRLFPDAAQSSETLTLGNSNFGESILEEEPVHKEEPKEKKKRIPANGTRGHAADSTKTPSAHQAIIDAYVAELRHTPPNMGREGKAAKWLVQHGYTPEQVLACYRHLKADKFWSDKFLSLQKVAEQIAEHTRAAAPRYTMTPSGARITT